MACKELVGKGKGCEHRSILTPQVWSEELFKLAMNILAQNASRNTFLRKA